MALDSSNSSNLEQLALKGLMMRRMIGIPVVLIVTVTGVYAI